MLTKLLGGFLADPITSFPNTFGPGSAIGGKNGVGWMKAFPYALPNLFSGVFILISAMSVIFGLDETHEALRNKPDYGRKIGKLITSMVCRSRLANHEYAPLATDENELQPITRTSSTTPGSTVFPRSVPDPEQQTTSISVDDQQPLKQSIKSPFRRILTKNIILTLTSHFLLAMHVSSFNALIFLLLPAPHSSNTNHHFPSLRFTGGLSLSQSRVGLAMAILGIIGLPLQIIFYPPTTHRLGTLPSYRIFLPFSILAYTALPFLVLLPTSPSWRVWALLAAVLGSQVLSRTFALTGTVILVNNSSPGPETLGTIHGVAQSVSSAARMLGPTIGGWLLGLGLKGNLVGGVWWGMAIVASLNWALLWCIHEGDGKGQKG